MTNKDMLYLGLTEDDLEIGKCSIIEITRDDLVDFLDEFGLRLVNHTEIPPIALCDWHDMVLNRYTRKLYKFNNWMIRNIEDEINIYEYVRLLRVEFENEKEEEEWTQQLLEA